jgi:hypothetical protein
MSEDPFNQPTRQRPLSSFGLTLLLIAALALPVDRAMAATPHVTLVRPSSTGDAKTARLAVLKQRTTLVGVHKAHPGTTVGGSSAPRPKTIVTKRFLPK